MLVATYRPVDITLAEHPLNMVKQDLLVHQLCREIALDPLTEAQVAEYMALEAAGAPAPAGVAALIHRYSEGNPLFMVASLDHMIHRNLIAVENGAWRLKVPLESIDMEPPASLRQMIELQIERLSVEEQRVLEIASVTGVSFTVHANALEATVSADEFESVCEDLARRQLMLRRANHFQDGRFPTATSLSTCCTETSSTSGKHRLAGRSLSGASVSRLQRSAAIREFAVSATALMSIADSDLFSKNLRSRMHG